MIDDLGTRIKEYYEDRTKTYLTRRTYTVLRLDGRSFSSYTSKLNKPFDDDFLEDMDETAKYLCSQVQGAKFGFTQSDEISLVLTDFDKLTTNAWFDGAVQKIVSIAAALATAKFNQLRRNRDESYANNLATFDCRVFTIPEIDEVVNYCLWRQLDGTRNSISMASQSLYSSNELKYVKSVDKRQMMLEKGIDWDDYSNGIKYGRAIIRKEFYMLSDKKSEPIPYLEQIIPEGYIRIMKHVWVVDKNTPKFNQDRDYIIEKLKPKE